MSTLPNGVSYQGIYCYRSDDHPTQVYYIPGTPMPQRNADGVPAISLLTFAQMAMLQLSSQWEIPATHLQGLKTYLEQEFADLKADTLQLTPAPLEVEAVTLSLMDASGKPEVLETARSSGHPPYSTVFSVQLSNEQKAQAISAFNGRKNILTVTYEASLPKQVVAEVHMTGNVSSLLKRFSKDSPISEYLQQIEAAVVDKQLKFEQSISPDTPDCLRQKTEQLAKEKTAELLQLMVKGATRADPNHLKVTARLTDTVPIPVQQSADVSTWFPQGKGLDYVQLLGA
ncbi:MAG: hypothetical protein HC827_07225 [Cyanobacteria bacterium RM1_2_2]|nr:hypothetical protein [Cyanobacteria bacterium RM1_2_2]